MIILFKKFIYLIYLLDFIFIIWEIKINYILLKLYLIYIYGNPEIKIIFNIS